jgi:hypothetical protein
MIRLLAAALLLTAATVPAFACDYTKSASTTAQAGTVASQAANAHATAHSPAKRS